MNELKKWLELLVRGIRSDGGDSFLRLIQLVEYGESFEELALDDELASMELEDMREYLHMFIDAFFMPLPGDLQQFGVTSYTWIKREENADIRDIVLHRFLYKPGLEVLTNEDADALRSGEFPIKLLDIEEEQGLIPYVMCLRLAFDPNDLISQLITLDDRILFYQELIEKEGDDPPME